MGEPTSGVSELAVPAGTVTLLLADMEGSTRLWEERGAEMAGVMASLGAVVDDAVASHEGVRPLEQGEGDSFVAAFSRASDAVACALALQLSLAEAPIALRVGLHTGEVQLRDEANYIGPALNRCARLRDVAHGGQVVCSKTTADLVTDHLPEQSSLWDLGSHRLRDLGRPEQVFQLCHLGLRRDFPPLRSLDASPHNLPVELTSFIGRQAEIAECSALFEEARLVTLTGSGGCGKTRLALQVAAERLERNPDGVWLVELAPVEDPDLIPQAIAEALSVREHPGVGPLEAVVAGIGGRRLLVVADNCEHLVAQVAEAFDHLLRGCPALSVLATSREPLGVSGEVTWRVPSLSFPEKAAQAPLSSLDDYDAVRLFVERARRARPRLSLGEDDARAVAEICRRLDGLPLAIELAAARARALSPAQISAGLHDRFRLLTGGARTAVPRQQTLEASVGWSFDLLLEAERALLRRLAVFSGGFTLEAAEAVCTAGDVEAHHVLDLLSQLVDKSLVLVDDDAGEGRFRLLETVRLYAAGRLVEVGESSEGQERHFEYFSTYACPRSGESEDAYRHRLRDDYDNLRRALSWAAEQEDPGLLLCLTRDLYGFWSASTHLAEACQWLRTAIDRGSAVDPGERAEALANLATLATLAQDMPTASAATTEGLAILEELGDKRPKFAMLTTRGLAAFQAGETDVARQRAEEAVSLAEELGDQAALASSLSARGTFAFDRPADRDAARVALARSIEVARECGAQYTERTALATLGMLANFDTELEEAARLFAEVLPGVREIGDGHMLSFVLLALVSNLALRGRFEEANAARAEMASIAEQLGETRLEYLPAADHWIAFCAGDWQQAVRRLRDHLSGYTTGGILAMVVGRLAWCELLIGDLDTARTRVDEFLDTTDPTRISLALPLAVRAMVAREEAHLERAEDLAHDGLALSPGDRYPRLTTWMSLAILAAVKTDLGSHEVAARLWGAVDGFRRDRGIVALPAMTHLAAASQPAIREVLGDGGYEQALAGGAAMSLEDAARYANRGRGERRRPALGWSSLTPTERQVVKLVAEGCSNPEIAERMFVSRRTVTTHLTNIFRKLDLSSRTELTAAAVRQPSSRRR